MDFYEEHCRPTIINVGGFYLVYFSCQNRIKRCFDGRNMKDYMERGKIHEMLSYFLGFCFLACVFRTYLVFKDIYVEKLKHVFTSLVKIVRITLARIHKGIRFLCGVHQFITVFFMWHVCTEIEK